MNLSDKVASFLAGVNALDGLAANQLIDNDQLASVHDTLSAIAAELPGEIEQERDPQLMRASAMIQTATFRLSQFEWPTVG